MPLQGKTNKGEEYYDKIQNNEENNFCSDSGIPYTGVVANIGPNSRLWDNHVQSHIRQYINMEYG